MKPTRISHSIIAGETSAKCWNCNAETSNVSITFECAMCSEECDDAKFADYVKVCGPVEL